MCHALYYLISVTRLLWPNFFAPLLIPLKNYYTTPCAPMTEVCPVTPILSSASCSYALSLWTRSYWPKRWQAPTKVLSRDASVQVACRCHQPRRAPPDLSLWSSDTCSSTSFLALPSLLPWIRVLGLFLSQDAVFLSGDSAWTECARCRESALRASELD